MSGHLLCILHEKRGGKEKRRDEGRLEADRRKDFYKMAECCAVNQTRTQNLPRLFKKSSAVETFVLISIFLNLFQTL